MLVLIQIVATNCLSLEADYMFVGGGDVGVIVFVQQKCVSCHNLDQNKPVPPLLIDVDCV